MTLPGWGSDTDPRTGRSSSGLTVEENLKLAARLGDVRRWDLVYELFPDPRVRLEQSAGSLSGGQQQMHAMARAMLNPNRLLLIDDPTKGLAPIVIEDVMAALRRAAEATTVVLVEQNLAVATDLATDVVVLDQGREFTPAPWRSSPPTPP